MKTAWSGAMTGALVGFIARGAVAGVYLGNELSFLALPSAFIGALVGGIAGATAKPIRGAIVGGLLSGLFFEIIVMSFSGLFGKANEGFAASIYIALQMAVAGAIAGGLGGLVGMQEGRSMPSDRNEWEQSPRMGIDKTYQQVVGAECVHCKERIASAMEAGSCPGCQQPLHYRCGVSADKTQAAFLCGACRMNASP